MPNFKKTQNSFSLGVVSPDFFARNTAAGVSKLENISVGPTGILSRRPGTQRLDRIPGGGDNMLIPFGTEYLLVLSRSRIRVYKNGVFYQTFTLNWNIDDIENIQWVQRFDTMIFVHPTTPPRVLRKNGELFSFSAFSFDRDNNNFPILPFMRFPDTENVSLTLASHANGTNWARVTASSQVWNEKSEGGFMMLLGRKWQFASFISPREAIFATTTTFAMPSAPVTDWQEAAFSDRRGWPCSITFFQDRLVFGGSRDWPCGLWLSKTGRHHNFDVGTGLDDEAIFITLLSEMQQKICTCISSRDLQVLTDSGEWAISSNPLTPSNINVRQHTGIGTLSERFVPPQKINGNTVFISNNNREIRELALDDLGESYNANDLTLATKHLMNSPVSMAYSAGSCQLFVVMQAGDMAVLTKQPLSEISAWCVYKTAGYYKSVAVQDNKTYAIVARGNEAYLEMFSADAMNDSTDFDFSWEVASTPLLIENHSPKKIRITHASARVMDTRHIKIQGRDFHFEKPSSGDITTNVLGTMQDASEPLWKISSSEQFPATILSVGIDGSYEL